MAETTEFVKVVTESGHQVDYLSPQGGKVPLDSRSLKEENVSEEDKATWQSEDFQHQTLLHSISITEADFKDYAAVYFTGGHGVLWDFPDDPVLQKLLKLSTKTMALCVQFVMGLLAS
ncbi:hypothetical protein [Eremococcus coleocola]|uniref:hypothetical protein n=1 Tax=Eremococcus coleocola TaxID=88132 RepID=UPI000415FA19